MCGTRATLNHWSLRNMATRIFLRYLSHSPAGERPLANSSSTVQTHCVSWCASTRSSDIHLTWFPSLSDDQLTETNTSQSSPRETLENDLFADLSMSVPPTNLRRVAMGLDIFNVQFDHMRTVMKLRGKLWYEWEDTKLIWDPDNYDNIRELSMHYNEHQTWIPLLKFLKWANLLFGVYCSLTLINLKLQWYWPSSWRHFERSPQIYNLQYRRYYSIIEALWGVQLVCRERCKSVATWAREMSFESQFGQCIKC